MVFTRKSFFSVGKLYAIVLFLTSESGKDLDTSHRTVKTLLLEWNHCNSLIGFPCLDKLDHSQIYPMLWVLLPLLGTTLSSLFKANDKHDFICKSFPDHSPRHVITPTSEYPENSVLLPLLCSKITCVIIYYIICRNHILLIIHSINIWVPVMYRILRIQKQMKTCNK